MCKLKEIAVLIALLGVVGVQSELSQRSDICAYENDGTRLALPLDCKRFVLCVDRQIAEIRSCPRGLHFNRKLGECDFQWRADCSGLSLYANTDNDEECVCTCCADECNSSEPGIETTTPCAPENETTDANVDETTNESSFGTDTTPDKDTSDSTFNPSDSSSQAPPSASSTPLPNPSDSSSQAPPVESTTSGGNSGLPAYCADQRTDCVNQPDGSSVPVKGSCSNYIICSHGCCNEFTCPSGLYYNFETRACDHFWNVECTPDSSPDANGEIVGPSGTTCSDQSVCAGQRDNTMFANPDTNGYFVCQCQCPIAMPCDVNTKFNETARVCDWDRTASSNAVICPDGLVYNATSNECDYPPGYVPKVECPNDSTICQGQEEGALFPIEGVCNMFYKCNFNCAVEQSCPNNLIWDDKNQICDYPQNVECKWPYTPPSGPNAGPSGISCEDNGRCLGQREGTYLPSLTSCSGYSVCQCECEVKMQCKNGLYWDPVLETCNYDYNVKCTL